MSFASYFEAGDFVVDARPLDAQELAACYD
jgi:hypothetical protein